MIGTERLIVRPWRDADRAPFATIGRDPDVMRFLGPPLDRAAANAAVDRAIASQAADGFCFWAVERRDNNAFLGFCGMQRVGLACPVGGEIEVGWRLRRDAWGQGYATEAALAVCRHAFDVVHLPRIVAFTVAANGASQGVMTRIGMGRRADLDFDHPRLADDDPLRPHIVFVKEAP